MGERPRQPLGLPECTRSCATTALRLAGGDRQGGRQCAREARIIKERIRRRKGSVDSTHYLERDELAGLKRLQREQEPKSAYVFMNERGEPFGRMGIARMIE